MALNFKLPQFGKPESSGVHPVAIKHGRSLSLELQILGTGQLRVLNQQIGKATWVAMTAGDPTGLTELRQARDQFNAPLERPRTVWNVQERNISLLLASDHRQSGEVRHAEGQVRALARHAAQPAAALAANPDA